MQICKMHICNKHSGIYSGNIQLTFRTHRIYQFDILKIKKPKTVGSSPLIVIFVIE